mmetsp:Transcript_10195/g.32243  ORF Transcript_10195/g.32243 Transcript_10195/m.32243 type:complete len:256 (-) Transcript_10195:119-886(-)
MHASRRQHERRQPQRPPHLQGIHPRLDLSHPLPGCAYRPQGSPLRSAGTTPGAVTNQLPRCHRLLRWCCHRRRRRRYSKAQPRTHSPPARSHALQAPVARPSAAARHHPSTARPPAALALRTCRTAAAEARPAWRDTSPGPLVGPEQPRPPARGPAAPLPAATTPPQQSRGRAESARRSGSRPPAPDPRAASRWRSRPLAQPRAWLAHRLPLHTRSVLLRPLVASHPSFPRHWRRQVQRWRREQPLLDSGLLAPH